MRARFIIFYEKESIDRSVDMSMKSVVFHHENKTKSSDLRDLIPFNT